jgi:8-oxo-dGTP pyrophosphatase MutT (NUDIX family)
MDSGWPRIRARRVSRVSPWVELVEREVEFSPGAPAQTYHALAQTDYVAVVARTPGGQIPIVRQYRPAIECFSWELPAGLVDAGEEPAACCARELLEETGYPARTVHALGSAVPCTARLPNRQHSFFVETGERIAEFAPEPGIEVALVSPAELAQRIIDGTFNSQIHLGALLQAALHGHLQLPVLTTGSTSGD